MSPNTCNPCTRSIHHITKEGKEFPVEINSHLFDFQNETVVIAIARDITERKQIEIELKQHRDHLEELVELRTEELKKSELWLGNIFSSLKEAVLVVTPDRNITNINDAVINMFGYSKEELTELSTKILHVDEKHYVDFGKRISEGFKKDGYASFEFEAKRKNGEVFPTEHTVSELKDESGQSLGIVSVVKDITKRKKVEEEIQNSNNLLQALNKIQTEYIKESDKEAIFEKQLENLLSLTQSEYGFISEVLYDSNEKPYLKTFAITNIAWNKETKKFYKKNAPKGLEFRNLDTLYGAVVKTGEPVISNDPANDPRGGGIPEGHPPLNSFLGIPLYSEGEMLGTLGIANRPGGYDDKLVEFLDPFFSTSGNIIQSLRMERELTKAGEDIHLLRSITQAVNETQDFHSALEITLKKVCDTTGWDFGESWIPNSDESLLEYGPVWYNSSNKKLKNFKKESEEITFLQNKGLPGRIWSSKQPKWIQDVSIESEKSFPRAKNAMKASLKTGLGVPLIANDQVLAVLVFFNSKSFKEDKEKVEIVSAVVAQLGSVVQRKKAEKALQESEIKYRTLFTSSRDAIYMSNSDGTFVDGNESLFNLTGYTKEELQEINLKNLYATTEERDKFQKEIEKTGYIKDYDLKIKKKDGTILQCLDTATVRYDENGKVIGYQGTLRDVTESRKRLELIQKLSYAIDQSASSVVITDTDGKIEYVNPKFIENTGYSEDEVLTENPRILKSGEHGKEFYKEMWDTIKSGKEWRGELHNKKKSGELHWNSVRISPISDRKGNITHFVAVHEDITERKKFKEDRRILKEKVERAERMESMGVMAGGVAHDLNNILGPILGYPDLIMEYLPENSPARDDLHLIKESAISAAELIGDLLTLARRGRYQMETLNLNDVIRKNLDSAAMEREKVLNPKVKLEILLAEDIHNIEGSAPHLSKMIMNLLINAYEALSSGGHVKVRSFKTTIDETTNSFDEIKEGNYVVFEVEDDGVGMNKEDQKKIFEPFYTKKKMGKSGTGLGLAIVWGVIKDHGGYINVKSEKGSGTKFTIYFPISNKDISSDAKIPFDLRGSEKILVVDDDRKQRTIAHRLLTSLGYEVEKVSTGREAIKFLKKEKVDIVLLDMILGDGLDGLGTYKAIIKINPGQKAIIVSGFSETDQVRETIKLGAGACVNKPYTANIIGKAVREELDKEERII